MIQRKTIQRTLVLEAVNQLKSHATADEVYRLVSEKHPSISKATVYRDLKQLAESGEIRVLDLPGGSERYDHLTTPHYHVKCIRCGKVFDLDMDYLPDLAEKVRDTNGFELLGHDIVFRGVCPACKTAGVD